MNEKIDIVDDRKTSLSELRDALGWNTNLSKTSALVMILCQRIESLEKRIEDMESVQRSYENE